MKEFGYTIEVESLKDLQVILRFIKNYFEEEPELFQFKDAIGYKIFLKSDMGEWDLINELKLSFPYTLYEDLGIGQFDIKIYIKVVKAPVPDSWGRVHNSEPIVSIYSFVQEE